MQDIQEGASLDLEGPRASRREALGREGFTLDTLFPPDGQDGYHFSHFIGSNVDEHGPQSPPWGL